MQQDLEQTFELEPGRERIAQPAYGRLQADPLLLDQLQPVVGLVDPLAAITGQQPQQQH